MSATYVAIIMDGNGRWAHQHGVPIAEGHKAGADTVKARLRDAVDLGIRELTLYSFSTENWNRPQDEVDALMALFSARIIDETPDERFDTRGTDASGRPRGAPSEIIAHILLHERGHHGDISTLLDAFGVSLPPTDYLVYAFVGKRNA